MDVRISRQAVVGCHWNKTSSVNATLCDRIPIVGQSFNPRDQVTFHLRGKAGMRAKFARYASMDVKTPRQDVVGCQWNKTSSVNATLCDRIPIGGQSFNPRDQVTFHLRGKAGMRVGSTGYESIGCVPPGGARIILR